LKRADRFAFWDHKSVVKTVKKIKDVYGSSRKPISQLQSVTCHMGSHLPPDTGERAPP